MELNGPMDTLDELRGSPTKWDAGVEFPALERHHSPFGRPSASWPLLGAHKCWTLMNLGFQKDTLWLFNIAMENGPFTDDFPINTTIYRGFSMAMLDNQMV